MLPMLSNDIVTPYGWFVPPSPTPVCLFLDWISSGVRRFSHPTSSPPPPHPSLSFHHVCYRSRARGGQDRARQRVPAEGAVQGARGARPSSPRFYLHPHRTGVLGPGVSTGLTLVCVRAEHATHSSVEAPRSIVPLGPSASGYSEKIRGLRCRTACVRTCSTPINAWRSLRNRWVRSCVRWRARGPGT